MIYDNGNSNKNIKHECGMNGFFFIFHKTFMAHYSNAKERLSHDFECMNER